MVGIDNLDTIAQLDFLCDDIGVDTMNTGVANALDPLKTEGQVDTSRNLQITVASITDQEMDQTFDF